MGQPSKVKIVFESTSSPQPMPPTSQFTFISSKFPTIHRDLVLSLNLTCSGGGFDSGASSDPKIDGSYLAARVWMEILDLCRAFPDHAVGYRESFSRASTIVFPFGVTLTQPKLPTQKKHKILAYSTHAQRWNGYIAMFVNSEAVLERLL